MKEWITFCGLLIAVSGSLAADPGIVFGQGTRMILSLDSKAKALHVKNYSEKHFLLHAKVINNDPDRTLNTDFIVTPEVVELVPQAGKVLTLRRLGGEFAADRESLLYLVGKFIPNISSEGGNRLELAYSITMKLFLRPPGLMTDDAVDASREKVEFSYQNNLLTIRNPTPYHLVFNNLEIDGRTVVLHPGIEMLKPMGSLRLPLSKKPQKVTWSFINDSGYETPHTERLLQN